MARIIGLDIDEGYIAATQLAKRFNQVVLEKSAVLSDLKEVQNHPWLKGARVIINLPAQIMLLRTFHVSRPFSRGRSRQKELIGFLQRQNLPLKLEECFWDTFILNSNLNLVAVRKETVERYIAQLEQEGLRCLGVTVSPVAIYNVFIYNYPQNLKERLAILNIKSAASDLVIYDARRIWAYPLAIGKKDIDGSEDSLSRFTTEVGRTFNAHYLQNPSASPRQPGFFYLCGEGYAENLLSALKKSMGDFQVAALEPLKKIKGEAAQAQNLSLSLGLGLTHLVVPGGIKLNLIQERRKRQESQIRFGLLRKAAMGLAALAVLLLLFWNAALLKNLQLQLYAYNETEVQVAQSLPELKVLKEEKAGFQDLENYLAKKINQQVLYLKSLAVISESKSAFIGIKELEISNLKDAGLQVFLSGSAPTYDEINTFLANLKDNKDLQAVKVVASSLPGTADKALAIDFKLRFEIE